MRLRYLVVVSGTLAVLILGESISWAAIRNAAFLMLSHYFLAPSAIPDDPRVTLASRLFDALSEEYPGEYEMYDFRLRMVTSQLHEPGNRQYYVGRMHLETVHKAEALGNWEAAVEHYREAIAHGTEQIKLEAHLALAELHQARGYDAGFEEAMQAASQFLPALPIHFTSCPEMELLGGYIDEWDLELDVPIHVVLIWKNAQDTWNSTRLNVSDDDGEDDSWRFYSWQDRTFQVGVVENLVRDGGFGRVILPRRGIPAGYRPLFRRQEPADTALILIPRLRDQDIVLELYGRDQTSVGLGTVPVRVNATNAGYLLAGWYRSDHDADPRIGIRWLLKYAVSWDDNISSYAVRLPSVEWTRFGRLLIPPDNTGEAQVWVIEVSGSAHLYVDNLSLIRIPLPCQPR